MSQPTKKSGKGIMSVPQKLENEIMAQLATVQRRRREYSSNGVNRGLLIKEEEVIQEEASFEVSPIKESQRPKSTEKSLLNLRTGMAWTNVEREVEDEEEAEEMVTTEVLEEPKTATIMKKFFVSENNEADVETTRSKGAEYVMSECNEPPIKLEECGNESE